MEDDDEFGDLYTDVLSAFPSSSSSQQPPHPPPPPPPPPPSIPSTTATASPPSRPIDLNLQSDDFDVPSTSPNQFQPPSSSIVANPQLDQEFALAGSDSPLPGAQPTSPRVLQQDEHGVTFLDVNDVDNLDIVTDNNNNNNNNKDGDSEGLEDLGSEPVIPGLNTTPSAETPLLNQDTTPPNNDVPQPQPQPQLNRLDDDDWDSDSEDDLQIVLNDNNHGPMGMDANGVMDDEDEDGDELVILANDDAAHQPPDDQDWGDDAPQAADGKEPTDPAKPNAALPTAPKVGYSNFGYHPFHSQFKYVRPGAAPLPGGPPVGSGGAPGQVRPPVNMSSMAGRGRGEWRPPGMKGLPMQKGFHSGFWGGNAPGRGLEFTLPSHKTIFDVDIDSFEEKPWKYPGVDVSDFFNFGLNEDSWKEYCKQLEQLRLESTMQSKIRVYESGRAEQEYDPDLPPELAAAAGIHDSSAENADSAKTDGGLGDLAKGSIRVRPPLPTGRAIQVETGYGERLPSVDTRPPRLRDSDAVIEDSMDDESPENGATEDPVNHSARVADKVDVVDEDGSQDGHEYFDGYPQACVGTKEDVTRERSPTISSPHDDIHGEDGDRSSPQRTSSDYHSGSRGHAPTKNVGSPYEERWTKGNTHERSPHMSSGESALDRRSLDYQREGSIESLEGKHSPVLSSPKAIEDAREPSLERKVLPEDDVSTDKKPAKGEYINVDVSASTSKDKHRLHSTKQHKPSFHAEPSATKEVDDGGDVKASRSSDNSKATGSSRDHQKWREGLDEEVMQNGRSTFVGDLKRHRSEGGHDSRRKDRDGRMEVERNYTLTKGREEYYSHRDWDPYAANHFHLKSEGMDRRKERDYSEVSWQRRDEEAHGRRVRSEDARKQDRADELMSRHRGKVREIDRSDKDEYLHSRKLVDNGSWRGYHEKDVGLRYREKDDSLRSRQEVLDDHHSKRRKDDEHVRRDYVEKEDMLLAHRESSSTRRKRERDDISSQRKRDDQPRVRDNMDDHHAVRVKDEIWVQRERERGEQQRERDEWYRPKQSYEESISRREREDGRASIRSSRNVEEKTWVGHARGKEEYKAHDKETGRHGEQVSRRVRVEDETSLQHRGNEDLYARGNQYGNEGKRSRQERSSARSDRVVHASDNQRVHEKKHKDNMRKARESEGTSGASKRHQGEKGVAANEMADMKGTTEQIEAKRDIPVNNRTGENRDVSTDEEQHDSKRGRSKLERWTSHKERDYAINSKLSSSLKTKDIGKDKTAGSGSSTGIQDEFSKKVEDFDKNRALAGGKGGDSEEKDADAKHMVDGHLDTVEKLKRRSERFKLPLTSEKEPMAMKKIESESLPPSQSETPANPEIKQERPPRKRRWISS